MLKLRTILFAIGMLVISSSAAAQSLRDSAPEPAVADGTIAQARIAAIDENERRESAARERADLKAQESMASSANALLQPSWAQVWIGAAGILGLMMSLSATAYSLYQTRQALGRQERSNETALRAYVGLDLYELKDFKVGGNPRIKLTLKNFGQTPAYGMQHKARGTFVPIGGALSFECDPFETITVLNPGESFNVETGLGKVDQARYDRFVNGRAGEQILHVGELTYDSFDKRRTLRYAVLFYGTGAKETELVANHNWSD